MLFQPDPFNIPILRVKYSQPDYARLKQSRIILPLPLPRPILIPQPLPISLI
jgi:hypothetical protein